MNLADVMIDEAAGDAIVPGRVTMEGRERGHPLGPPDHQLLGLSFGAGPDSSPGMPKGSFFYPVPKVERLPSGFCAYLFTAPRMYFEPLTINLLQDSAERSRVSFTGLTGSHLWNLHREYEDKSRTLILQQPIVSFEFRAEAAHDGLKVRIDGTLGDVNPNTVKGYQGPMPPLGRFGIEALVPWELVAVKGFRMNPWVKTPARSGSAAKSR